MENNSCMKHMGMYVNYWSYDKLMPLFPVPLSETGTTSWDYSGTLGNVSSQLVSRYHDHAANASYFTDM